MAGPSAPETVLNKHPLSQGPAPLTSQHFKTRACFLDYDSAPCTILKIQWVTDDPLACTNHPLKLTGVGRLWPRPTGLPGLSEVTTKHRLVTTAGLWPQQPVGLPRVPRRPTNPPACGEKRIFLKPIMVSTLAAGSNSSPPFKRHRCLPPAYCMQMCL